MREFPTFTGAASAQLAPTRRACRPLFRIRTSDAQRARCRGALCRERLGAKYIAVLRSSNEYGNGWRIAIEDTLTS